MTSPHKPWWLSYLDDPAWAHPFIAKLEIDLKDWSEGRIELGWKPPSWTRVPAGWVQGGFLGVPLDMAQTLAAVSLSEPQTLVVTLDMRISFLESSMASEFVVTGKVERLGRRIAYTSGEIHDVDGKRVATASATNMLRKVPIDGTP